MQVLADLHLHSKYSRAVSQQMEIPEMYKWNLKKGIDLLATGDWTHPLWIRELKTNLEETGSGLLKLKPAIYEKFVRDHEGEKQRHHDPMFILSTELSCIYSHHGKTRRIHIIILVPSFKAVDDVIQELNKRNCKLASDGRPILGLTSQDLCELIWSTVEEAIIIPAHVWTPWFSLFGSKSGYDSLEECFGQFSNRIYSVETGLSSDPAMNWQIKELDTRTIISNSDSHSNPKLMREANIINIPGEHELSFSTISSALQNYQRDTTKPHIAATIEFYPEEGKYHYSGHRNCQIRWSPQQVKQKGTVCPVCGKALTIGVANRVEALAARSQEELKLTKKKLGNLPISATYSQALHYRPPYVMLVPLLEILAESLEVKSYSQKVYAEYEKLVNSLGSEYEILMKAKREQIARISGEKVAEGVDKVRKGDIVILPGYDGEFGTVKVWGGEEEQGTSVNTKEQMSLF